MPKYSWIRLVYLYLMTAIGLVVFIIGSVTLLNIALKMYVFTQADSDNWNNYRPSALYPTTEKAQVEAIKSCNQLTEADQAIIAQWLKDYQKTAVAEEKIDYQRAQRERDAARGLAMILVGFPIYWIHWSLIKRDKKDKEV